MNTIEIGQYWFDKEFGDLMVITDITPHQTVPVVTRPLNNLNESRNQWPFYDCPFEYFTNDQIIQLTEEEAVEILLMS